MMKGIHRSLVTVDADNRLRQLLRPEIVRNELRSRVGRKCRYLELVEARGMSSNLR